MFFVHISLISTDAMECYYIEMCVKKFFIFLPTFHNLLHIKGICSDYANAINVRNSHKSSSILWSNAAMKQADVT